MIERDLAAEAEALATKIEAIYTRCKHWPEDSRDGRSALLDLRAVAMETVWLLQKLAAQHDKP